MAEELNNTPYDHIVDLHNNLRSNQAKRLTHGFQFTLDKRNIAKWLYVQTKREIKPIGHIVERYLATVRPLGIEDDGIGLEFHIPNEERVPMEKLPEAFRNGFIAYAIGGTTPGKVLPTEKIVELCGLINQPIVLLGGKEDVEAGEAAAKAHPKHVYNACGKYSIMGSASLLDQANCVIAHDTGLMHIAAALGKKVVSMWFATTPEIGMSPWRPGAGSVMVEAKSKNRPTSKLGNRGWKDGRVFNIDLKQVAHLATA